MIRRRCDSEDSGAETDRTDRTLPVVKRSKQDKQGYSSSDDETVVLHWPAVKEEPSSSTRSGGQADVVLSGDEEEDEDVAASGGGMDYAVLERDWGEKESTTLDVFSLSMETLTGYLIPPMRLTMNFTRCKIVFSEDPFTLSKFPVVSTLLKKIGHQFHTLFIEGSRSTLARNVFLQSLLKSMPSLTKISYKYHSQEDALRFLELLREVGERENVLQLKLVSARGDGHLEEEHLSKLAELKLPLESLELGNSLWEDVKSETLEKILENNRNSLKKLVIHGGFRGKEKKQKVVKIPLKMTKLCILSICPEYSFEEKVIDEEHVEEIDLEEESGKIEHFKITLKFPVGKKSLPVLRKLILGNLIEVEDLHFSLLRNLIELKCGTNWDIFLTFPPEGSRRALMESNVTEFQFPDGLKDPSFPVKIAKHFPKLKKIWWNLPSVAALRSFFKAFENSGVEELNLKTQFDFASTLESCLMPEIQDPDEIMIVVEKYMLERLKGYKHFKDFVRYHNIELPVKPGDDLGVGGGIRCLKNLKTLNLQHIKRTLKIPIKGEQKKWYDPKCRFLKTDRIGFEYYPLTRECTKELLDLLQDRFWLFSFEIPTDVTGEAGHSYPVPPTVPPSNGGASQKKKEKEVGTVVKVDPSEFLRNTVRIKKEKQED